jgi:hypothetical protein
MFGTWAVDPRGKDPDGEPFDIPQHGLGMFAARRESWLRFPENLVGFSGGEGYIHEKYRRAGRRNLCLPFARWIHKFQRPHGIPHRPRRADKIRNHIRGWMELGVDLATGKTDDPLASMVDHYVGGGKITAREFEGMAATAGFPDYKCDTSKKLRGVVVGPTSWGSYRLRGRPVAERHDFREYNSRSKIQPGSERWDLALSVKCNAPPAIRERADRVIFEPLDMWFENNRMKHLPRDWIAEQYRASPFDDLIVSTLSMERAAKRVLPESVRVHVVPHHADPRIGLDWYDPDGPIVYAGHRYFIEGHRDTMREAAALIGREIVIDETTHSWHSLEGASLVLAPRLEARSLLNLHCKPTIKLANASAAGIPALATDDPANELFHDVRTAPVEDWHDAKTLATHFALALADKPSCVKFPYDQWLAKMGEIVEWKP